MNTIRTLLGRSHPPRVGIVTAELERFERPSYLEIGVNTGVLFLHVRAAAKLGVDPAARVPLWKRLAHPNTLLRGRLIEATSDEFFAGLDPEERFDVVFVDGDHRFEQSLRDVTNALEHLSEDGVILIHDCDPPNAEAASPDSGASAGGPWCGDVFKTIVHLRAARSDLRVETLDTDFGIGVVRRGAADRLDLDPATIPALGFAELAADRERLLGLVRAPTR